jgi:hypothetical protein
MSREDAVESYILLRLRFEDVRKLGFLVEAFHDKTIQLPKSSPYSHLDLKDTIRTAFFGWFATLTDEDNRAIYAFDPLLALFPGKQGQIIHVQLECEACHGVLQQFRNNVAFHSRSQFAAHLKARRALLDEDTFLDLESARQGFQRLMAELISDEVNTIPEFPKTLTELRVSHHPAFANVFRNL